VTAGADNGGAVVSVSVAKLAKWHDAAGRANEGIQLARLALMAQAAGDDTAAAALIGASGLADPDAVLLDAQELAGAVQDGAREALGVHAHGVGETLAEQVARERFAVPLDQLDTPDTRELLTLLERAQAVAERVDAARGRVVPADLPLLPGEARGTDLAERISEIALRVRTEIHGPAGRE
jgi:hypothetical protein